MDEQEALKIFHDIKSEYDSIPSPKYRHVNLEKLTIHLERLDQIKDYLKENMAFVRLINALSQIYKRLIPGEASWNNTSEIRACWSNTSIIQYKPEID